MLCFPMCVSKLLHGRRSSWDVEAALPTVGAGVASSGLTHCAIILAPVLSFLNNNNKKKNSKKKSLLLPKWPQYTMARIGRAKAKNTSAMRVARPKHLGIVCYLPTYISGKLSWR